MKSNCPSCGAPIEFRSRVSVMSICEYCQSVIVRHDTNLESLGKVSEIQEDMTPLQVGTTGVYETQKFEILGRQKSAYENGTWNEWYILFSDGTDGWLAEAQGFYMVSKEVDTKIPDKTDLEVGKRINILDVHYSIDDFKTIQYIGCEGELPVNNLIGSEALSVDLNGENGAFCNLVYTSNANFAYIGKYIEFEDFNFKSLREIDGWK